MTESIQNGNLGLFVRTKTRFKWTCVKVRPMRVLICEDDVETAGYIINGLNENGHVVDHAENGRLGLTLAIDRSYAVIVIDRMLPELDGLGLVTILRKAGVKTPVLILTALGG